MRGKKIRLLSKKTSEYQVFDRSELVAGTTKNGIDIPAGGVLLQNKILAGYLQVGGAKKWRIIGTVDPSDSNFRYIESYGQTGGGADSGPNAMEKEAKKNKNHKSERNAKTVSLRSAVNMLREYYSKQFN